MKHIGLTMLMLMLSGVSLGAPEGLDRPNEFGIFGVTIDRPNDILTKPVVSAASSTASAFGLQKHHRISAVPGTWLAAIFDESQLSQSELQEYQQRKNTLCTNTAGKHVACATEIQAAYVIVTGVFGGGCIGAPSWSLPFVKNSKPKAVGVTDFRCAKTDAAFRRLLATYVGTN